MFDVLNLFTPPQRCHIGIIHVKGLGLVHIRHEEVNDCDNITNTLMIKSVTLWEG